MSRVDDYRQVLRTRQDWEPYLLAESGLPGPRGNLELAQAVAEEGDETLFVRFLAFTPDRAPTGSAAEFLAFCGVLGHGRLLAQGRTEALGILRQHAADPRWRIREAVAMALQRFGDADMAALLRLMAEWSKGTALEKRAAAAALCEPRLLTEAAHTAQVLAILDAITASLGASADRRSAEFRALRQGLAYCWSVAVAAQPASGERERVNHPLSLWV